ncbi:hypothetical protein [Streptomyces sp. NPDC001165]|uniref:hypothetical protein n=1 Tax=Streptomyces sp. NPDC001165 TaxID=3364546 RepID=UPI0036B166A0
MSRDEPDETAARGRMNGLIAMDVHIAQAAFFAMRMCGITLPTWLPADAPKDLHVRADCVRLLALADVAGAACWECQQATGEPAAAAAADALSELVDTLERTVVGALQGREILVDDAWMMSDPEDDLQRPIEHRGTITSVTTAPFLQVKLATDSGRTMTASQHMWTVSDRATRQVLYGPPGRSPVRGSAGR